MSPAPSFPCVPIQFSYCSLASFPDHVYACTSQLKAPFLSPFGPRWDSGGVDALLLPKGIGLLTIFEPPPRHVEARTVVAISRI